MPSFHGWRRTYQLYVHPGKGTCRTCRPKNYPNREATKLAEGKTFYVADSATEDLTLEVFNATNDIPAPGKIGTDRDATFRLVDADGARLDIPADFARKHYAISLYGRSIRVSGSIEPTF